MWPSDAYDMIFLNMFERSLLGLLCSLFTIPVVIVVILCSSVLYGYSFGSRKESSAKLDEETGARGYLQWWDEWNKPSHSA